MQSFRSRLLLWALKNRQQKKIVDENFDVQGFRDEIDKAVGSMKLPKSVNTENVDINGMNGQWITPENPIPGKILLYIHGGGFISGSIVTHRMHVAKFAKGSGLKCLLFDYRLAPEHPFPAAPEDCLKAYRWLLENGYKADDIVVGGESAGATLTLSLLHLVKRENLPLPKAAFVISPVTDLRCLAESFTYNAKNDIAPMNSWKVWTEMYIADSDPTDPILSPQFGDFDGFPPLYICVGSHEIHLDDCRNLAEKAHDAGVNITFTVWDNMVHAFPIMSPLFPEAKQALAEICEFARKALS